MPAIVASSNVSRHAESSSQDHSARQTNTHLTYSRQRLIAMAKETIRISESGKYTNRKGKTVRVKDALTFALDHCVHYDHGFDFHTALRQFDSNNSGLSRLEETKNEKASVGDSSRSSQAEEGFSTPFKGVGSSRRFPRTSFIVVSASWLQAASELTKAFRNDGVRVGVLNSASGTTPGGRFLKGTVSQEDCLCRASLLYACISQPKFQSESRFYGKNRTIKYGSSNCLIFSPDVPVVREDTVEGKLLDHYERVSFVSLPAPNAFTTSLNGGREYNDVESEDRAKGLTGRSTSVCDLTAIDTDSDFDAQYDKRREALLDLLSDRISRALSAFALGSCTDLVLPAFGCGVHGNDPSMVAAVCRELLTDPAMFGGRFRTVVFAIPPSRKSNYQAFASYFQKK